jgi:tRNA (guanine37-N1)-methyltransferase
MKIDILTLFPKMFDNVLGESMIKLAQKRNKVKISVHNLRDWTHDRHKTADDKPYGGGSGMVMKVEPIYRALECLLGKSGLRRRVKRSRSQVKKAVILLTPKGRKYSQEVAKGLSKAKQIVLICGHYEGFDERVRAFTTDEISIGDYVLTGGEIPAMVVLDSIVRLIPGVLGDRSSLKDESFENGLLEYPHYTRPREFKGLKVPEILLSGKHNAISDWRRNESIKRTKSTRKDLLKK